MQQVSGGRCQSERVWQELNGGYEYNVTYITKFSGFEIRYFLAKNLKKQENGKLSGRNQLRPDDHVT